MLKIPIPEQEEESKNVYVVKKGDSLYKIAKEYDTTTNELIKLNNLSNTNLSIGQILKIPIEQIEEPEYLYTVKSGDSLYKIAREYNTTVDELMKLNNLSSIYLNVGQTLKIPQITTSTQDNYYTVKGGDNLYKIANQYNTTVDNLIKLNNLSSTTLSIGQKLKLK